jgi:hypothetical protein
MILSDALSRRLDHCPEKDETKEEILLPDDLFLESLGYQSKGKDHKEQGLRLRCDKGDRTITRRRTNKYLKRLERLEN